MTREPLLSPLGLRLAAAFVTVAVAAVAVLAVLTLVSARDEVSSLVHEVHQQDARSAAAAAARAFEAARGWDAADLTGAAAVAARGQANLTVRDGAGAVIAAPAHAAAEMMAHMHGTALAEQPRGEPVVAPVVVGGREVGSVELRFPASHLPTPERQIRAALSRNVGLGAALAVLSAVAVAVFVARRVSRPVNALTAAAADLESGRRDVRVTLTDAPGELGTLAAAFNRMAAAVEHEDRLRRQLVADVAHEVRTPLTILRGTTEALVDGVAEPDDATLASLHEEVLRLVRLVGDLETLAAADAAGLHLERGPVDLAAVAGSTVDLARAAAEAAHLAVVTDLEAARVDADEARVRQVLTTLLANAIAYTPPGGTLTVATRAQDGAGVVEVADTGPGIDPVDRPHVFERFYRGRASAGTPGSGIGLAVARELVQAHGGDIDVGDRPGGGARLTVTLPAAGTT